MAHASSRRSPFIVMMQPIHFRNFPDRAHLRSLDQPRPELLYAQVVKSYRRRRVVHVRHRVVFGTVAGVNRVVAATGWQINTAFSERVNLTIRRHVAAVGRRVITWCKGETGVGQQLTLYHVPEKTTDIPWLACTIAWMHVDLLALQEILTTPDAEFSLNALRTELNRLTGGSWDVDLQSCAGASTQHVGFLWNRSQVALQQRTDVWELNGAATGPTDNACAHHLRPG